MAVSCAFCASSRLFPISAIAAAHSTVDGLGCPAHNSFGNEKKPGIDSQFVPHYALTGKAFLTNNSWAKLTHIMENPRKLRILAASLGIALLVSLGALSWALYQNYWWRRSVDFVADEAGASLAMKTFHRGQLAIWEINPTNDFPRFSGRRDGPFEVWFDEYHAYMPAPWQYAQRRKLEAHNRQMHYMYEHPERFTPGQDETRQAQRGGPANRSQPIRSETNTTSSAAGSDR
jgi:hypothetical protein